MRSGLAMRAERHADDAPRGIIVVRVRIGEQREARAWRRHVCGAPRSTTRCGLGRLAKVELERAHAKRARRGRHRLTGLRRLQHGDTHKR